MPFAILAGFYFIAKHRNRRKADEKNERTGGEL
jgi:hypothetical protein